MEINLKEGEVLLLEEEGRGYFLPADSTPVEEIDEAINDYKSLKEALTGKEEQKYDTLDFAKRVLRLIEEIDVDKKELTDDPDISNKFNTVTNQLMFELFRYKGIIVKIL